MKRVASKSGLLQALPAAELEPGTLLPLLRERAAGARRDGTLPPLAVRSEVVEQEGIAFQARLIEAASGKEPSAPAPPRQDPAWADPALFVAPVGPSHVALLSTRPLFDQHLIVATRTFEDQRTQLTQKDCEALLVVLTELDGLAWYDARPSAGAPSAHKHFDAVPLEDDHLTPLPLDSVLHSARADQPVWSVPGLPFRHACAPMDPDWTNPEKDCGASLHACYRALMRAAGLSVQASPGSHAFTGAYHLLATRKWLLLIPRAQERVEDLAVEAPAFAGVFLVRSAAQLAALKRHGPLTVLRHVAFPA